MAMMTQYKKQDENDYYPLYLQVRIQRPETDANLKLYWDLVINTYNLVKNSNYGIVSDLQTVFLLELCVHLNSEFRKYLGNKVSQKILIKRLQSIVTLYNDFIIHSDDKYINRYMPKIYNIQGGYKLGLLDWSKRNKLYNHAITYQILSEIKYLNS